MLFDGDSYHFEMDIIFHNIMYIYLCCNAYVTYIHFVCTVQYTVAPDMVFTGYNYIHIYIAVRSMLSGVLRSKTDETMCGCNA